LKLSENVFVREDFCEECWPSSLANQAGDAFYSHWETRYRDPAAAKATPETQYMPLLKLFYEAIAGGMPADEPLAYVCALILRRQKVFRFVREEKEGDAKENILVFHDRYHDVQVKVVDPNISEAQFREVKQKLEAHLSQKDSANER